MRTGPRPVLRLVALFVLAPLLAVVLILVLLLFHVDPHLVFLPGHLLRHGLLRVGIHAPNAMGVLTTVAVWWGIVVVVWLAARRVGRRM